MRIFSEFAFHKGSLRAPSFRILMISPLLESKHSKFFILPVRLFDYFGGYGSQTIESFVFCFQTMITYRVKAVEIRKETHNNLHTSVLPSRPKNLKFQQSQAFHWILAVWADPSSLIKSKSFGQKVSVWDFRFKL